MKKLILVVLLIALIALGWITYNNILLKEEAMNVVTNQVSEVNTIKESNNTVLPTNTVKENEEDKVNIILTGDDTFSKDSSWCGIFQLIWNDLKNDLAKQNIIFANQPIVVDNLNKGGFTTKDISEKSYYKTYGSPTLKLKAEIEKAIKEKFNETSDILDDFEWQEEENSDYFLYGMLKKDFKFGVEFEELPDGTFGNKDNVKFFGTTTDTDTRVKSQVQVLYYDSKDNFAVKLMAEDDEVIICKGSQKTTFNDIYAEINEKSIKYKGDTSLQDADELKVPNIKIDTKKEFKELENQAFKFADGSEYMISQALQTIKLELDKTGVKLKSEAGMTAVLTAVLEPEVKEPRYFYVDDSFTMFLVEKDKEKPYFAAHIDDIEKYQ